MIKNFAFVSFKWQACIDPCFKIVATNPIVLVDILLFNLSESAPLSPGWQTMLAPGSSLMLPPPHPAVHGLNTYIDAKTFVCFSLKWIYGSI
jgi:hypothetical protein